MPTGAEIAAALAIKAAESFAKKVGENVADEFTDWLFGSDDDEISEQLSDIQNQLRLIDRKISIVIDITTETLTLVREFPDILEGELTESERDTAYRELEADYDLFLGLAAWDGEFDASAQQLVFRSWRTILDLEHRSIMLTKLPRLAELVRFVTGGRAAPALLTDLKAEIVVLESNVKAEIETVSAGFDTAFALEAKEYLTSVSGSNEPPWISWIAAPDRYYTWFPDCSHFGFHRPEWCDEPKQKLDTGFKAKVSNAVSTMKRIQSEIDQPCRRLFVLQGIIATLNQYVSYLERVVERQKSDVGEAELIERVNALLVTE